MSVTMVGRVWALNDGFILAARHTIPYLDYDVGYRVSLEPS